MKSQNSFTFLHLIGYLFCFVSCSFCANSYWSMWHFINYNRIYGQIIKKGVYELDFTQIQNWSQYDEVKLEVYALTFEGANYPWEIILKNTGLPAFEHRIFGYAVDVNENIYQSETVICPMPKSGKMSLNITNTTETSFLNIFVTSAKLQTKTYFKKHSSLLAEHNLKLEDLDNIESQWDKWFYFQPVNLINEGITNKSHIFDYSKIPNIQNFECVKNHAYFVTGRSTKTTDFYISWINQQKPEFQHRSFGSAYDSQTGYAYNSQNVIVPLASNKKISYQASATLAGGKDFMRVFYYALKFKSNVTKIQRELISREVLSYLGQSRQSHQDISINQEHQHSSLSPSINSLVSYPYPGYWNDWYYFEPTLLASIKSDSVSKSGSFQLNLANLPGVKLADEVKLWVYTKLFEAGAYGQWVFTLTSFDDLSFVHNSHGICSYIQGVTFNSEELVAPIPSNRQLTLLQGTIVYRVYYYVYAVGLKFKQKTSFDQRENIMNKLKK